MLEKGEGGKRANVASATVIIVSLQLFPALAPLDFRDIPMLSPRTLCSNGMMVLSLPSDQDSSERHCEYRRIVIAFIRVKNE